MCESMTFYVKMSSTATKWNAIIANASAVPIFLLKKQRNQRYKNIKGYLA